MDASFGIFQDRCKQPPSPQSLAFTAVLTDTVCEFYPTEEERRSVVNAHFLELGLRLESAAVPGREATTDGHLEVNVMPAMIRECKNDQGYALHKAIAYYGDFVLQAFGQYTNHPTHFPCILMTDIGQSASLLSSGW